MRERRRGERSTCQEKDSEEGRRTEMSGEGQRGWEKHRNEGRRMERGQREIIQK